MLLYRGTTSLLLENIREKGLVPSPSVWSEESFFDPTLIYVTTQEGTAWEWAKESCTQILEECVIRKCKPILLRMDSDSLPSSCQIVPDPVYEHLPPQEYTMFGIKNCTISPDALQFKKTPRAKWQTF